jgi:hypothetical protein
MMRIFLCLLFGIKKHKNIKINYEVKRKNILKLFDAITILLVFEYNFTIWWEDAWWINGRQADAIQFQSIAHR